MTNEQEVVRSVFSSYINDLKAHSTKPDRPMFKMLEDVKDKAIKALEAQPCIEDYPTCTECEHYDKEKHYCPRFCQVIKDTLAEAQPKKGRWIHGTCQECKFDWSKVSLFASVPRYCPNCGAKMEVKDE